MAAKGKKVDRVRAHQRWEKKDTGRTMTVIGKTRDNCWHVRFDCHTRKATHTLKERDIKRYYTLL